MLFTRYELNLDNKINILMFSLPFISFLWWPGFDPRPCIYYALSLPTKLKLTRTETSTFKQTNDKLPLKKQMTKLMKEKDCNAY
jgi:hypothetical protein